MSKITKLEGKAILANTTPVENFSDVLAFICKDTQRSIRLTSYMRDGLTELFGKHNQRFKGNHYYYVWVLEFNGNVFHLYTHKDRGTDIEIIHEHENKTEICLSFLTELDKLLKENE